MSTIHIPDAAVREFAAELAQQLAPLLAEQLAEQLAAGGASGVSGLAGGLICDTGKQLYSEAETARLLGVSGYFLKKSRQDGLIQAHTTKRPILYSHHNIREIVKWLAGR